MIIFPLLGLLAFAFGILNEIFGWLPNDHMSGVISGVGGGLIGCGAAF